MRVFVFLMVIIAATPARADVTADIKQTFKVFVDGVGKKQFGKVELFIPPGIESAGMPTGVEELAATIPRPIITYLTVVPSASGKSAWLAAEISAHVTRRDQELGKRVRESSLRASAYLVLDGGAWRVTATHWSVAHPNVKQEPETCGRPYFFMLSNVPKQFVAPVNEVIEAIRADDAPDSKTRRFSALMSDDKRALLIGTAAGERVTGGPAIKALFKRWTIGIRDDPDHPNNKMPARAGGDGELMWIGMNVTSPAQFCILYRALFMLAKEPGGWRIVHQHYSETN